MKQEHAPSGSLPTRSQCAGCVHLPELSVGLCTKPGPSPALAAAARGLMTAPYMLLLPEGCCCPALPHFSHCYPHLLL